MSAVFFASYVVLWVLVLLLVLRLITMPVGMAGQRVSRTELAMSDHGLSANVPFPIRQITTVHGVNLDLSRSNCQGRVVIFASPSCAACAQLYPHLAPYAKEHPELEVLALVVGDRTEVHEFATTQGLGIHVCAATRDDMRAIQTNIFPFAYFLAPDGVILSKGVVNNGPQMDMLVANGRTTKPVRTRVLSVG